MPGPFITMNHSAEDGRGARTLGNPNAQVLWQAPVQPRTKLSVTDRKGHIIYVAQNLCLVCCTCADKSCRLCTSAFAAPTSLCMMVQHLQPCVGNLQGALVHPGWNAVVPCEYSLQKLFQSLELGNLDMPVCISPEGLGRQSTLQEFAAVPQPQFHDILVSSINCCVNALTFTQAEDDACYRSLLGNTGRMLSALMEACQWPSDGTSDLRV